jgi:excinuclease ABC subunit A
VGLGVGEVRTLTNVLRQLVDDGHTVLVVEHNLDVIAGADWIVDMGPGAAAHGGRVVVEGPPAVVAACEASKTGQYLRRYTAGIDATARAEA